MGFLGALAFLFTCLLLFLICFWAPPSDDTHKTDWAIGLTDSTKLWIAILPSIILLLFGILFRCILPPTEKKKKDVEGTESEGLVSNTGAARYDAVDADTEVALQGVRDSRQDDGGVSDELAFGSDTFRKEQEEAVRRATESGQVAKACDTGSVQGDYSADWTTTFDFYFLIFMVVLCIVLVVVTQSYQPKLWSCGGGTFWLTMIAATAAQMAVGIFGGCLARYYCLMDENNLYTITSPKSYFKVNYTRKLQHLAAYVIPLVITPPDDCMPAAMYPSGDADALGLIQAWWAHFFTLLGFLALIKPLRETFTILMLQFNSMDRPEDRPNCLNWLIGGNVFPGYCLLIPLRFFFSYSCQQSLIYIVIFIVGLGDGFAEPVGVNLGVHKYQSRGCDCADSGEVRYYTRSWEGSATVFLSGIFFPCIQYYQFANAEQFILALILLPPFVTFAEATAPHTMDTVSLILVAAGILLALFWIFPSGHIDPHGNPSCSNPSAH